MGDLSNQKSWPKPVRIALACSALVGSFFAPLLEIYPRFDHRLWIWSGPAAVPDKLSLIANECVGLFVLFVVSAPLSCLLCVLILLAGYLVYKVWGWNNDVIGDNLKAIFTVGCVLIAVVILVWEVHWAGKQLIMMPIREFSRDRLAFPFLGLQIYMLSFIWISADVLGMNIFAPADKELRIGISSRVVFLGSITLHSRECHGT
jgi:hypothetical protein